jgi:phosphoribosylanthranilate isomerase
MHLTITGFDNQFYDSGHWDALNSWIAPHDDLFVEFGFLMYPKKYGNPRYPDKSHLNKMIDTSKAYINALHICGNENIYGFLKNYREEGYFYENFDRFQLNADWSDKELYQTLLDTDIDKAIILQYNEINAPIFKENPLPMHNIHYLIDESRGNGHPGNAVYWINQWRSLMGENTPVGFAGGINLSNISKVMERLKYWGANKNTWIDMETGCRDSMDQMDLMIVSELICIYNRKFEEFKWE